MTNNKILNLLKVAIVLLLLSGVSMRPAAANDELGIAFGAHAGLQGFSGVASLCERLARETVNAIGRGSVRYECETSAFVGGAHIRLRIAPQHSIVAAGRISGDYDLKFNFSEGGREAVIPFSVTTGSVSYEYIAPLGGPDTEGFIKAGYHTSEWEISHPELTEGNTGDFNGFMLGAGLMYDQTFVLGYEYLQADADLEAGHVFYAGAEFSL